MSSYLTINNVAYAAGAVFCGSFYYQTKTKENSMITPIFVANAALGTLGIAAVIVKEKSLQSSKWAIIFSLAACVGLGVFGQPDKNDVIEKKVPFLAGFSLGLTAFAAASLIFASGKQIAPYLIRR